MNEVDPHIEARLDEALEETFPASDPPAVSLSDDPPRVSRFPEDQAQDPTVPTHRRLIQRVLAGGALAVAGVAITRMILMRKRKRTLH